MTERSVGPRHQQRLLLRGGDVIDGTGRAPFRADIVVEEGCVSSVLRPSETPYSMDAYPIDCTNKTITPGFIDTHAHDDLALLKQHGVKPKLLQGVTCNVVGNCGHGCAPVSRNPDSQSSYSSPILGSFPRNFATNPPWQNFPEYLDRLSTSTLTTNATALIPHGALRSSLAGHECRALDRDELDYAIRLLKDGLEHGAAGMSLGLMYAPGNSASHNELAELAHALAAQNRILAVHLRSEGDEIRPSLDEILRIGHETGVAIQLSHLKVVSPGNHGRMAEIIDVLNRARLNGVDVTADVYPYTSGSTTISAMFPQTALADGVSGLLSKLRNSSERNRIIDRLKRPWSGLENNVRALGGARIAIAGFTLSENKHYEGETLEAIAADRGEDPLACLCDLTLAENGNLSVLLHQMSDADVELALSWPWSMIGSDGLPIEGAYTHPRMYGTYPRLLTEYVNKRRTFDLSEAIRKMTTLAARRFGLGERGMVSPGKAADLVVFDPDRLHDQATFSIPRKHPDGIDFVLVNGCVCVGDQDCSRGAGVLLRRGP